jgi:hypothetical protein
VPQQEVQGIGEHPAEDRHQEEGHEIDVAGQDQIAVAGLEGDQEQRMAGGQSGCEGRGDCRRDEQHRDGRDEERQSATGAGLVVQRLAR